MNRFDQRLTRELDEIADRATTSASALTTIRSRAANYTDEYEQEVLVMFAPSDTGTRRPRWIIPAALATAAAGVLAVIGAVVLRDTGDTSAEQTSIGTELPAPAGDDTAPDPIDAFEDELAFSYPTRLQQDAVAVVIAHNAALNARDGDAMLAMLTPDAVWDSAGIRRGMPAEETVAVLVGYGWGITETFAAEPTVAGNLVSGNLGTGDLVVAVPTLREVAGGIDSDGITVYTLRHDPVYDQFRISEIFWMPLDQ